MFLPIFVLQLVAADRAVLTVRFFRFSTDPVLKYKQLLISCS